MLLKKQGLKAEEALVLLGILVRFQLETPKRRW